MEGGGAEGLQTGYMGQAGGCPMPMGPAMCAGGQALPAGIPPQFVAGLTAPQYGMPITGTPIGLPGPPHIPMGIPAGLQRHTIANHTKSHIPGPVKHFKMDVKQEPGFSYPQPVSHMSVTERSYAPPVLFHQPKRDKWVGDAAACDAPEGCDLQDGP
jgi:hypothetical protein